jgi:DNA-binding NarL/FixJ family response regulator
MQTTLQGMEISVAILMDDLASAKEIASALRHSDVLAHHYQSLEEFWVGVNLQTPDLVIVDVTKMSLGSAQFRNHPKVIDKSMHYAFFSKESTKILLQSAIGLEPMAFLHGDSSLHAQVTSLVSRRIMEMKRVKDIQELETRVQRLQARSQRLISERSAAEEFRAHFDFIRNLCLEIENESLKFDFTTSLLNKMEKWQPIDGYGLFELNQNGQKLISPDISKPKFHPFPSLWLGQVNHQGIEPFAEEMASQVANDLFEIAPITLKLHAGNQHPDLLLFVSFKEEWMANFPWDVLESMLSSSLRKIKLNQQVPKYSSQFMPMWEALDNMDRLQKSGIDSDTRILALSLIPLTDVAKKKPQNKFYWSSFFNDFFLQLSSRLQKSTKLSLMGPWHVIFFIPSENLEIETRMLQTFIKQFSYWKFFEDNSQVLPENMLPTIRLIPASSAHYLRNFEKEFEEVALNNESKRLTTMSNSNRISF